MSEVVSSTVCEGEVNEGVTTSPEIITIDDGDDDDSQTREIQDLWRDKRRLTEENNQHNRKIIILEADLTISEKNDTIQTLRNQVKSNKEFHEKALQEKINDAKSSAAEIKKLEKQNQDMDLQVAKLKKEAEELQVRLTATTTKCDEEKKLAEKTTDDLANVREEISTKKHEIDAQKQEIAKLKKEIEKCGEDAKTEKDIQQQKIAEIEKSLQTSEDNVRELQKVVSEQQKKIGELEANLQKSRQDDQVLFQDSTKIMQRYKQLFQQLDDDDDDAQYENSEQAVGRGQELQDDSISKGPQLPENAEQVSAPVAFSNKDNDKPGPSHSPVCLICKKSFGDENALRIHLSLKHNQNRSNPEPKSKTSGHN
ncbi:Keratin, type II cytoskeletal 5 [Orchesella cincta]|uniref:Keratin, type II cytoskeletal 5 n=1 Tax=Orchesella cincta TaxID=48709 RepID=A0A1D2MG44_ORCCI|nr:Keratin, type II cytoskeletal 5 [Orchesella cincta]